LRIIDFVGMVGTVDTVGMVDVVGMVCAVNTIGTVDVVGIVDTSTAVVERSIVVFVCM